MATIVIYSLVSSKPTLAVLLRGQRCGRRKEATRYPTELLWHLHVQPDSKSGRAKQAYRHRVQGEMEKVTAYFTLRRSRIVSRFKFNQGLIMEVDTGTSVTVISEATRGKIWPTQPAPPLHPTDVKLRTYTGEAIPVIGKLMVKVEYQGQEEELPLVVAGDGPSPLGQDWLAKLKPEWKHLFNVQAQESL